MKRLFLLLALTLPLVANATSDIAWPHGGQAVAITPQLPVSCDETAIMILDSGTSALDGAGEKLLPVSNTDDGSFLTPSFGPIVWWRMEVMDGPTPIKSVTGAAPSILLECAEFAASPITLRITGWGYDLDAQPQYEVCGVSETTIWGVTDPLAVCP